MWLATNHFVGEGYWFWTIPLQGKTSLGLVYDREKIPEDQVSSPEKVVQWICRQFPLMARDLPKRKIIDQLTIQLGKDQQKIRPLTSQIQSLKQFLTKQENKKPNT